MFQGYSFFQPLIPPKWLSMLYKLPNVHLFWRVCLRLDLARAWESKPRHRSLGTTNSAICYSTMETTKKTDFICSAVYGFHKDPVLQGAVAAASRSALPTGALGQRAFKPLICLSSLPPSLPLFLLLLESSSICPSSVAGKSAPE